MIIAQVLVQQVFHLFVRVHLSIPCPPSRLSRFPSYQTWFLLICLVVFRYIRFVGLFRTIHRVSDSIIEWVSFAVLNIGLPAYESLPSGTRAITGLFQGLAARASGFAIVPIAAMAPSLQCVYVLFLDHAH